MNTVFFSLWLLVPIGAANMAPIFLAAIPILKDFSYPLDGFKKINNTRIFGDHKTIRGMIGGTVVAIIFVLLEQMIYRQSIFVQGFSQINYSSINGMFLGFLSGFGALGGDAVKSFFKRQFHIPPGESLFLFDQIDYIIGAICMMLLYVHVSWMMIVLLVCEGVFLHVIVSYVGYLLHLKKAPI